MSDGQPTSAPRTITLSPSRLLRLTSPRALTLIGMGLLGLAILMLLLSALVRQLVFEGTSEANYLSWETRPLFFLALGATVVWGLALVAVIIHRVLIGLPLAALALAMVVVGTLVAVSRAHPMGHERDLLDGVRMPSTYLVADYEPATNESLRQHDPPTIVRTWTARVDPQQACRDTALALKSSRLRTLVRDDVQIGPACTWSGTVDGWPVFVEVDAPGNGTLAEVPGASGAQQPPPPPTGFSRVDIWAQPPDIG